MNLIFKLIDVMGLRLTSCWWSGITNVMICLVSCEDSSVFEDNVLRLNLLSKVHKSIVTPLRYDLTSIS